MRLRSDEQLVSLFRLGSEEAFRVIHDRYRSRLFAYTRQMLSGSSADAEDAVQEIFVRAYAGLRSHDRELALRAWLYRIAHNRCIDEIRRPRPIATDMIDALASADTPDPMTRVEQRDALRRLVADVQRLPEQQRSALLMRELGGMPYADVSEALGVSVPAVKSLLVRARVGLAQAGEARDTACARIREDLIVSHDRGVRTSGLARRHMRDCSSCRAFRGEVRGVSRQLAALLPALGPIGVVAKLLGLGSAGTGSAAAGTGAMAGSGAAAGGAGTGAAVGAVAAGAGHVATLIAAAVITAGGAIELQQISPHAPPAAHHHRVTRAPRTAAGPARATVTAATAPSAAASSPVSLATSVPSRPAPAATTPSAATPAALPAARRSPRTGNPAAPALSQLFDPDDSPLPANASPAETTTPTTPATTGTPGTSTGTPGTSTGTPATPTAATATPPTTASSPTAGATGSTAASSVTSTGTAASSATSTGTAAGSPTTGTSAATGTDSPSSGATTGPTSVKTSLPKATSSGGGAASGMTSTLKRTIAVVVSGGTSS